MSYIFILKNRAKNNDFEKKNYFLVVTQFSPIQHLKQILLIV